MGASSVATAQVDSGVIRLGASKGEEQTPDSAGAAGLEGMRRGFDYQAFTARLEALWFQRKSFLADRRRDDAARQGQLIRAYCEEEGVKRLKPLAGALVTEAVRFIEAGDYDGALDSLSLASAFDPGRPELRLMRARIYWQANQGYAASGMELLAGLREAFVRTVASLSLLSRVGVIIFFSALGCLGVFSMLMLVRYQLQFRHEIEEWIGQRLTERWARSVGWTVLFLPLLLWFTAGWVVFYWIAILFRYMRGMERGAALALLLFTLLSVPFFSVSVTLFGMTADPLLRATRAATEGQYAPDRVIQLRRLVDANPDNPTYRFLLAGLYKNGRFFEEAFDEYKQALQLNPGFDKAHVNIGNIFYLTGQHSEAIANYRRALEINPGSALAHYNSHLAQSESFRFKDAEDSLRQARRIDSDLIGQLLAAVEKQGQRSLAVDATLKPLSLREAAFRGASPLSPQPGDSGTGRLGAWFGMMNPIGVGALGTLGLILVLAALGRGQLPASRCIRCGCAFCRYCKSTQRGHEYCNQCMHLFVLGDGLSPEAKQQKTREVERFERHKRLLRRVIAAFLPGSAHVLTGHAFWGSALLIGWFGTLLTWNPAILRPVERLIGLDLRLHLLESGSVPPAYTLNVLGMLALVSALGFWLLGNLSSPRSKRI